MERHLRKTWALVSSAPVALWSVLLLVLGAAFLYRARHEIGQISTELRTAHLRWLSAILIAATLIQLLNTFKLQTLLRRLGCHVPFPEMATAQLQRNLILTFVPAGAAPSSVVLARKFAGYGVTAPIMLMAFLLFSILGHASFVLVLAPVLVWISITGSVSSGIVIAAVILSFLVLGGVGMALKILRDRSVPVWFEHRLPARARSEIDNLLAIGVSPRQLAVPLGAAIGVDLIGIAMLWAALRALDAEPTVQIAATGYVVGTLFLMIAPLFQGIGVVELSMAIALERAGVPNAAAFGATMLYRVGEVWTPLAVGIAVQIRAQERLRRLPRNLPAILTGATGVLSVLSVMAPTIPRRFNRVEDYAFLDPHDVSRTFSLVAGAVLIALSLALIRRRVVAWWAATAMLAVLILSHLFKRHDQIVSVIAAVNLAVLLITRRRFRVRSDIPTMRRGAVLLTASLLFAVAYGTFGFWLLDRREFGINFTIWRSVRETLSLYFNFGTTDLDPRTRYADWFLDSVSVVGVISIVGAMISVLRPVVWRRRTLPQERAETEALIGRFGRSGLDEFKTWPDKLYFFSADRLSVICYGYSNAVAVVLGDPVARDSAALLSVLAEFLDFCDANAWQAAFHQVGPDYLREYRQAGLAYFKLGEEAIVEVGDWALSGHGMKPFRAAVNRLSREGYVVARYDAPLSAELVERLRAVSDAWLALPGRRERGFTLGSWNDTYIRRTPVFTLSSSDGRIVAFINLIRDGVPGEGTFDMMRHLPDAPNGSIDVLLIEFAQYLQASGQTRLSLGMVPFVEVGTGEGDPILERGIHMLVERMERFFSYRGLRNYKEKFHPTWEPRYLVYQSPVTLPQVILAIVHLTEDGG